MRVSEIRGRGTSPMTLGRLLALVMGSLAVSVMAGIWWMSAGLLRDQAEEQALARVRVAGLAARDQIRRASEDSLTAARLLASRPTLKRTDRATAAVSAALLRDQRTRHLRRAAGRPADRGLG